MKLLHRSVGLGFALSSLSLAIACGSNDSSGLFTSIGGDSAIGTSGASSLGGSASSQAGQSSAGTSSSSSGASGSSSVAGQSSGGANSAGDTSVAGGSSDAGAGGDTGGTNTAGGASGSGAAGDTSVGGSSAGTAGDASMGGTASGSGGASTAGTGGLGGSGGLGDPCPPDAAPPNGSLCVTPTPDSCFYPGTACSCVASTNSIAHRWSCYGSGDKCPAGTDQDPVPMDGASCKGFGGSMCPYSAHDFCVCFSASGGAEPRWQCSTDPNPVCPQMRPDHGGPCLDVKECDYADRECFCNGASWTCE